MTAKLAGMDFPKITLFFAPKEDSAIESPKEGEIKVLFVQVSNWGHPDWCVKVPTQEDHNNNGNVYVAEGYLRIEGIPNCPGEKTFAEVSSILDTLLPEISERDPVKRAALVEKARAVELERSKAEWIKANSKFFERTLKNTQDSIDQAQKATEKAQQEVVKQIRIREGQERKLQQLEASRPQVEAKYAEEFDRLAELPHVIRVAMDGNKIQVFTDRIYVEHAGNRYDIGDFRLEVFTDGSNGGVLMHNLTRRVDAYNRGMQAPHVFPDGKPCLGNLKEAIPQYIGEGEYSVVVMLCVQYLQSVNTADAAGKHIDNWPHVAM